MKYLLLAALLIIGSSMNAQDSLSYDKMDKYALSEELNNVKANLSKTQVKLDDLNKTVEFLTTYQDALNKFSSQSAAEAIAENLAHPSGLNDDTDGDLYSSLAPLSPYQHTLPRLSENSDVILLEQLGNTFSRLASSAVLEISKEKKANSNKAEQSSKFKSIIDTKLVQPLLTEVKQLNDQAIQMQASTKLSIQQLKSQQSKIYVALDKGQSINQLAIYLGLPIFCFTILVLFTGQSLIKNRRLKITGGGNDQSERHSQNTLLEISTVLLLTMSILILGLSDKIKGDVLGTLLGGISGYVLNRVRQNISKDNNT